MRSLEVIIAKNAEAAGRAEAHARNDGDINKAQQILGAHLAESAQTIEDCDNYERGYRRGRQEG
jgi:hypothetical protein